MSHAVIAGLSMTAGSLLPMDGTAVLAGARMPLCAAGEIVAIVVRKFPSSRRPSVIDIAVPIRGGRAPPCASGSAFRFILPASSPKIIRAECRP